jgi:1-acyl-sn-glycerol-3-phosphate acyltransferase
MNNNKPPHPTLEETCMSSTPVAPTHEPAPSNQFALLAQRRFAPFFWVQFFGAGNDNVFKFAFTVLVTYQLQVAWLPASMAGLVIGALFILPFLLFSATSGQLADKYPKEVLIRFVKSLEIGIMLLAGWGFVQQNVPVLLGCVFLMGLHSTLFGPVKFAYLPQHLNERELTGGNGMVEMGTFVAILLGQVAGGLLIALPGVGPSYVAGACLGLAVLGRVLAQAVPVSPATDPALRINWNPFTETWRNLKLAHGNLVVFRSLLGISWMWFFGAVFLSMFPSFARDVLHGDEQVASLLLVVFSIGIGIGALLCEMLSHRHVEIGLVPMGAIGMSVFSIDLYFASRGLPPSGTLSLGAFVGQAANWRVLADLALLSLFAGIYSVPMYALIQMRSQPTHRARIIAANNILNALFMIASSVLAGALLSAGLSIPQLFGLVGLANAVVAFYIFMLVPEYLLRFVAWVASRFVYRFDVKGDLNIPTEGAVVLACNHVSFVDAVLLMAASPRPIRFLMDHRIFKVPVLGWLFRLAKAIPIAPQKEDPQAYEAAFATAAQVLREGDLLGIFPEGGITRDGTLQPFKGGIAKILAQAQADGVPVRVVPMALTNLWGSYFSRIELAGGEPTAMVKPFRRGFFNRVGLNVGEAMPAAAVSPEGLRERVASLMALPVH